MQSDRVKFYVCLLTALLAKPMLIAASGTAGPDGSLSNLQFMTGMWRNDAGLDRSEELWSAPAADMMVGVGRVIKQGKTRSFEYMRIESTSTGLVFVALPGGRAETRFPAIEVSSQKVVFENRENDFPQRVIYWRESDGRLHARIEGVIGGETKFQEWSWSRWQP